ncbi:MAG: hypothetical protein ACYDAL_11945 [Candidatus Dormibacteraceae bacterium]
MLDGDGVQGERVVLARKDPRTMVGFQWTGKEPPGLNEAEFAEALGAVWEGELLVTYNLSAFTYAFEHYSEDYLTDPD